MSGQEKQLYEFGTFRLDPVKRLLLRGGEPVQLTPKAFDTLLALVEQSGRTVEKDELMKRVWPGAVVEENNLNQNITALRKCLGDSRQESRDIATTPGLGYRFVAEVQTVPVFEAQPDAASQAQTPFAVEKDFGRGEGVEAERTFAGSNIAESAATAEEEQVWSSEHAAHLMPHAHDETEHISPRHKSIAAPVAFALLLAAATAYAFWGYRKAGVARPAAAPAHKIGVTALTPTATTGRAAVSPDGRYIVYSVAEGGRESLWLRQASA